MAFRVCDFVESERYLEISQELHDALCEGILFLDDPGRQRVAVMQALRTERSLTLREAKRMIDAAPIQVTTGPLPELKPLLKKLQALNASVRFEPRQAVPLRALLNDG